jgi:hypothetical protein
MIHTPSMEEVVAIHEVLVNEREIGVIDVAILSIIRR